MINTFYLNQDHTYRPCSLQEWANQFEEINKHVADEIINDMRVSTVWLGLNHNHFNLGNPLLFETMVFTDKDSGNDVYCERYSTWQEAEEGHKKAVQWVKDGCND